MTRLIIYSILGAIIAVFIGLVLGIGQWIGSGNLSILSVIIFGGVIGFLIAHKKNNK